MKHKNIMILGTASGVGKSMVVAGLCRILKKDGHKVTPFKSQNMALNSYVTSKGEEMGRAQVVQAQATELEPQVYMNPILLKPTGNKKIQVIVNGKSIGNMSSAEYSNYKTQLKPILKDIYSTIKNDFEICILEGAGSPVELNMKKNDISNLEMAKIANSPLILVADIDRGGVFASIYGTIMLLTPEERKMLKGVIINKFRGDKEILKSGLIELEKLTGKKILGIIPYHNIDIEDEDNISEKFKKIKDSKNIKISIIKLNHRSNTTDFNSLNIIEDVETRYINNTEELGDEDIIIIPGSKNSIKDMRELKNNSMATRILQEYKKGKMIIGICGGFQMLGQKIIDTDNIEDEGNEIVGLGILEMETEMKKEKTTTQFSGKIVENSIIKELSGVEIKGYEIHQGCSYGKEKNYIDSNRLIFTMKENLIGTYVHGIFDNREFTDIILNRIRTQKGIESKCQKITYEEYKREEFDKLEKLIRDNVDIETIYKILENGVDYDI